MVSRAGPRVSRRHLRYVLLRFDAFRSYLHCIFSVHSVSSPPSPNVTSKVNTGQNSLDTIDAVSELDALQRLIRRGFRRAALESILVRPQHLRATNTKQARKQGGASAAGKGNVQFFLW